MNPAIVAALDAFVAEIQRPLLEELTLIKERIKGIEDIDWRMLNNDALRGFVDQRIEETLKESDNVMSYSDVEELVNEKIDNIDYDEHVADALGNINLAEQISRRDLKEAISELTFTVEVS